MIKLSIKNESNAKREEFEGTLYLKQNSNGDVNLVIVDAKDNMDWYIAKLKTDGTIMRHNSLSDDIGLQVDDNGRIILSEEE